MRHIEDCVIFDRINLNEEDIIISLVNEQSRTSIDKHIDAGSTWKEVMKEFVDMLNGVGYVIDKVKASDYIDEMFEEQTGAYK